MGQLTVDYTTVNMQMGMFAHLRSTSSSMVSFVPVQESEESHSGLPIILFCVILSIDNPGFIEKPTLVPMNDAVVGRNFSLKCCVNITENVRVNFEWSKESESVMAQTIIKHPPNCSTLHLSPLKASDKGNYTCGVIDHWNNRNSRTVPILDRTNGDFYLKEKHNLYKLYVIENDNAVMNVDIKPSSVEPELTWYNHKQKKIVPTKTDKYEVDRVKNVDSQYNYITLTIKSLDLTDTGIYTLEGVLDVIEKRLSFTVVVLGN